MRTVNGCWRAPAAVAALLLELWRPAWARQSAAAMKVEDVYAEQCLSCHGETFAKNRSSRGSRAQKEARLDDEFLAARVSDRHWESTVKGPGLPAEVNRALIIYVTELQSGSPNGVQSWRPKVSLPREVRSEVERFIVEMVVEGLEDPWALAFLPDKRILVTERRGSLRIIDRDGSVSEPVSGTPHVWAKGQGGLLDVAVDPDYGANGWIYLTYSDDGGGDTSTTALARGRIVGGRWRDQQTLFKPDGVSFKQSVVHFGSRIAFDSQKNVFFSVGDRGFSDDAQSLQSSNGKIHRITRDGRRLWDEPFASVPGAVTSIWTYGHRNPQGLTVDPRTGELWETEQGPRGGDELNFIERGSNYGWPLATFGMNNNGTPITAAIKMAGTVQPVRQWTPSITVSSMAFYAGEAFQRWRGNLFVTCLVPQELRRLEIVMNHVTHEEIVLSGLGRARDVVAGPDGYLYLVLNEPGRVVRLVPAADGRK